MTKKKNPTSKTTTTTTKKSVIKKGTAKKAAVSKSNSKKTKSKAKTKTEQEEAAKKTVSKKTAPKPVSKKQEPKTAAKKTTMHAMFAGKVFGQTMIVKAPSKYSYKAVEIKVRFKDKKDRLGVEELMKEFNAKNTRDIYRKILSALKPFQEERNKKKAQKKNENKSKANKTKQKAKLLFKGNVIVEEDVDAKRLFFKNLGSEDVLMPEELSNRLRTAINSKNDILVKTYINFWSWCLMNPNTDARDRFFHYLQHHKSMMITPNGFAVTYRRVNIVSEGKGEYPEWVTTVFARAKAFKIAVTKNMIVIRRAYANADLSKDKIDIDDIEVRPTKGAFTKTGKLSASFTDKLFAEGFMPLFEGKSIKNCLEAYQKQDDKAVYTDAHTGKMRIVIGEEVRIPRVECDPSISNACSHGLHTGSSEFVGTGYGNDDNFNAGFGNIKIICFINPMDVVAIPFYDDHKMRSCAYFPAFVASGNTIHAIENSEVSLMDESYQKHQSNRLKQLLKTGGFEPTERKVHGSKHGSKHAEEPLDMKKVADIINARVKGGLV